MQLAVQVGVGCAPQIHGGLLFSPREIDDQCQELHKAIEAEKDVSIAKKRELEV